MQKTILTKKTLTQKESQTFNVNQAGLTAIFISARCKKRDKLKVEVVGFSFDQIFNGSKLKGLKQTAVFILNLEAGEHQINLMPKGDPIIEEIKIIEFGENVTLNFNGLEEQAEDGDRRPFYTFVIINQEIKSCTIDASVSKRLKDSDDIKIKINGKERLNIFTPAKSKSKWRFWLWIGGLKERLQNKTYRESKTIELNLSKETKLFIENVKKFYQENQQKNQNNGFVKIFLLITGAIISSFMIFLGVTYYLVSEPKSELKNEMVLGEIEQLSSDDLRAEDQIVLGNVDLQIISSSEYEKIFELNDDLNGDGKPEKLNFRYYYNQENGGHAEVKLNGHKQNLDVRGIFWGASDVSVLDINNDGVKELFITVGVGANGVWTEGYAYQNSELNLIPVDIGAIANGFLGSGIKFIDYDDDGELEVVSPRRVSEICDAVSEVYEYREGRFILTNEITAYKPTCEQWVKEFKG